MHRFWLAVALVLAGAIVARAQDVPHDFKQDTPPVPGQVVETPRDKLRLAPLPMRGVHADQVALPTSGPKGIVRESSDAERDAPLATR